MSGEAGRAGGGARQRPQALHDLALLEPADGVDERNDVTELRDRDDAGGEVLRRRHEPEAHLGHDAVVRLLEQAIDARTETRLELLPGLGARQSAHTGAHHPAVGQDHLDAALGLEMVAVGREGDADAAVQRIAQHTAPAWARDVDPELQALLLYVIVQIEIADARLHHDIAMPFVDLDDPIHPLQVENDAAGQGGGGPAVAQILARGDRIDGNAIPVGDLDQLDHLVRIVRRHRRGRGALIGFAPQDRVGIAIEFQVLVGSEEPLVSDDTRERLKRGREIGLADIGRQFHGQTSRRPWRS